MQEAQGVVGDKYYEFKYIEEYRQIIIWCGDVGDNGIIKNFKQKYLINVIKKPRSIVLNCNCPSGRYRHYCKHADFAQDAFKFNHITQPTSFIKRVAQDYYKQWLTNLKKKGA